MSRLNAIADLRAIVPMSSPTAASVESAASCDVDASSSDSQLDLIALERRIVDPGAARTGEDGDH
jgi:hypothetical protein